MSMGNLRLVFFQAEDGIRDGTVTGVQTCALPISKETCSACFSKCAPPMSPRLRCTAARVSVRLACGAVIIKMRTAARVGGWWRAWGRGAPCRCRNKSFSCPRTELRDDHEDGAQNDG